MILIKVADISNEARPMDVAEPWLDRLLQEFFAQSAAEKSEGLPVTPFMDPDKVSKPGSQVRFIGLVLLPLFEALGELVPELTDLIIIPVRIALEYYRRLNDAQTKTRKSVADSNTSATSDSNSGTIDSNAAMVSTPGGASDKLSLDKAQGNLQGGAGAGAGGAGGAATGSGGGGGGGGSGANAGSVSPQMPRSGSGISVKSRRSIPSQKSASRTSVDEPGGMAAELHDLPEGSESGDSETATEVDVAEKTSKFKVDTEGSSNRSKSSHSTSRKSSREKRPSMIGELCSSGGGQRIRNSYGNIHGYHSNRCHFGNNRAVSLDQYSSGGNNRRLSDGLPQVISDSNVFYGRHNRSSGLAEITSAGGGGGGGCVVVGIPQDTNANTNVVPPPKGSCQLKELLARTEAGDSENEEAKPAKPAAPVAPAAAAAAGAGQDPSIKSSIPVLASSSNGNISPPLVVTEQILPSNGSTRSSASSARGVGAPGAPGAPGSLPGPSSGSSSWKSRLRQFSDYFSFSFDKGNKRFGSTRSSPCSSSGRANNNANGLAEVVGQDQGKSGVVMCCNVVHGSPGKSGGGAAAVEVLTSQGAGGIGVGVGGVRGGGGDSHQRHRAYSLDVPGMMRYSSSDSSRHPSSNTLQSGGGITGQDSTGGGVSLVPPSLSVEMGLASGSSSEAGPKI
ncbi:hypothetical protein KR059_008290 [Drosophila kikkawai]|nr:hypothetical protein KR059_008290 [Drosophila kikkawai]